MPRADRRFAPYRESELEVILLLAPTKTNVRHLARLLGRSEAAIVWVYRIAFGFGWRSPGSPSDPQLQKIRAAKKAIGFVTL